MRYFSLHPHGLGSRFWEATRAFINSNDSYNHKLLTITSLIKNSQRTFILISDSGERDPLVNNSNDIHKIFPIKTEIYSKFSQRIHHIYIRNVREESRTHKNLVLAFQNISTKKWSLFNTGTDLPSVINYNEL